MGRRNIVKFSTLALLPVAAVFLISCSQRTLSVFFDLPPEKPASAAKPTPAKAQAKSHAEQAQTEEMRAAERPEIESTLVWDQAVKQLPQFNSKPDWVQALQTGIVKPRASIEDNKNPDALVFKYDFYYPGPSAQYDAFFPHSSHTEWLGCDSCHPKIFRTRGVKVTMSDLYAGKYCAVCHGSVAFGLTECTRCHTAMGK